MCGFYLHYSEDKVPEPVASWNVKKLGLHRDNRHLDVTVMLEVFRYENRCGLGLRVELGVT